MSLTEDLTVQSRPVNPKMNGLEGQTVYSKISYDPKHIRFQTKYLLISYLINFSHLINLQRIMSGLVVHDCI